MITGLPCPGCVPYGYPMHPADYYDFACAEHQAKEPFWHPDRRAERAAAAQAARERYAAMTAEEQAAEDARLAAHLREMFQA